MQKKKILRNVLLFLLIIIITFVVVFRNYDFKNTMNIAFNANTTYILLAIIAVFFSISFESLNIKSILGIMQRKIGLLRCIRYTLIDFFFSGITPGGGGGQPMELYFMNKEGIAFSKGAIALLIEVTTFHLVTLLLGAIGFWLYHGMIPHNFYWLFYLGAFLKFLLFVIMLIGLFSKRASSIIARLLIGILTKIKYHNLEEAKTNIKETQKQYSMGSDFIKRHPSVLIKSCFLVTCQMIMMYLATYFVYKSFGLDSYSFIAIILIQAVILVSTASIPLPGAVGVSESAFLTVYTTIFGTVLLPSAMVLSRGISFYLYIIISLLVVIYSTIKLNKRKKDD